MMKRSFQNGRRYGGDALNTALIITAFVIIVIAQRSNASVLLIPAYAAVIWAFFRMMSRNIFKRQSENAAFMNFLNGITSAFKNKYNELKQSRSHKFYKCPKCRAKLRLPRGKGKIIVSCPKCSNQFNAKT